MIANPPIAFWFTCDDCFPYTVDGRDVPDRELVFTADQMIHSIDFEDIHVVQMRCNTRYVLPAVVSIGSMPAPPAITQTSERSRHCVCGGTMVRQGLRIVGNRRELVNYQCRQCATKWEQES